MKILFIGDIVGSVGRNMVKEYLPALKAKYQPNMVIVNGENASSGKGLNQSHYNELIQAGAHIVTMGNHTWDQKQIFDFIDEADQLVRPANYPLGTPGKGYTSMKIDGEEVVVINVQGRTFMPPLDCPFKVLDEILEKVNKNAYIIVDFHAEATSEKLAVGWYLDGRVSGLVGTHTHVQTADNRVLPKGTAYITDAGMTGPYNGILGVMKENVMKKFMTSLPVRFEVDETGPNQLSAVILDLDSKTKRARKIERIQINSDHPFLER